MLAALAAPSFTTHDGLIREELINSPFVRAVEFILMDDFADDDWSRATLEPYLRDKLTHTRTRNVCSREQAYYLGASKTRLDLSY